MNLVQLTSNGRITVERPKLPAVFLRFQFNRFECRFHHAEWNSACRQIEGPYWRAPAPWTICNRWTACNRWGIIGFRVSKGIGWNIISVLSHIEFPCYGSGLSHVLLCRSECHYRHFPRYGYREPLPWPAPHIVRYDIGIQVIDDDGVNFSGKNVGANDFGICEHPFGCYGQISVISEDILVVVGTVWLFDLPIGFIGSNDWQNAKYGQCGMIFFMPQNAEGIYNLTDESGNWITNKEKGGSVCWFYRGDQAFLILPVRSVSIIRQAIWTNILNAVACEMPCPMITGLKRPDRHASVSFKIKTFKMLVLYFPACDYVINVSANLSTTFPREPITYDHVVFYPATHPGLLCFRWSWSVCFLQERIRGLCQRFLCFLLPRYSGDLFWGYRF